MTTTPEVGADPHPFQPDVLYPQRCGWRDRYFVICGWAEHVGFHVPVVAAGPGTDSGTP